MRDDDRDDEYDDRPRRRRRDDYDDEDERPSSSNGLAVVALVLGILSLCSGILTGIPAIICGALGRSRANQTGTGGGMALAGIILGSLSIVITIGSVLLLLPAVSKVRQAAAKANETNNAKQISLALLTFNGDNGSLPRAVYNPKDANWPANKGLSWRVGLLPYMEQDPLYRNFNLAKSWDDAANKSFSDTIVATYTERDNPTNQTRWQGFVGPGTAFDPEAKPLPIMAIRDGSSNTILFTEAASTIPWAAPQDIKYPFAATPPMGKPGSNTFLAAFGDGSVRSLKPSIKPAVLKLLIEVDDGKAIPPDAFD